MSFVGTITPEAKFDICWRRNQEKIAGPTTAEGDDAQNCLL